MLCQLMQSYKRISVHWESKKVCGPTGPLLCPAISHCVLRRRLKWAHLVLRSGIAFGRLFFQHNEPLILPTHAHGRQPLRLVGQAAQHPATAPERRPGPRGTEAQRQLQCPAPRLSSRQDGHCASTRACSLGMPGRPCGPPGPRRQLRRASYLRLGGCLPCHADRALLQRGRGNATEHTPPRLSVSDPPPARLARLLPFRCVRLTNSQEAASSKR